MASAGAAVVALALLRWATALEPSGRFGESLRLLMAPQEVMNAALVEDDDDGAPLRVWRWHCHRWSVLDAHVLRKSSAQDETEADKSARERRVCLRKRQDGLAYAWTAGDDALAPGCGSCSCCWREVAWDTYATPRAVAPAASGARHDDKDAAAAAVCGFSEGGYEYTGGHFRAVNDVLNATACCELCSEEPACTTWTWNRPGSELNSTCLLKSPSVFGRSRQEGRVSGISRAAGDVSYQFKLRGSSCMDRSGRTLHTWRCNAGEASQQWKLDLTSGQIRTLEGDCLVATSSTEVELGPCSSGVERGWIYNGDRSVIRLGADGPCLCANGTDTHGTVITLMPCKDRPPESSEWELRRVLAPQDHSWTTFMVYRAQSDEEYPNENVVAGDLAGVLLYLQHEVVLTCPRKLNLTRVRRLLVTARTDMFADFTSFDGGRCTAPSCQQRLQAAGYRVGCQQVAYGRSAVAHWYSLPGACPGESLENKTLRCMLMEPGGACTALTGDASHCVYSVEDAGEVRLDEVLGIDDYAAVCARGDKEYNGETRRGVNLTFWDDPQDPDRCAWRVEQFAEAFLRKYPEHPASLDPPACPK